VAGLHLLMHLIMSTSQNVILKMPSVLNKYKMKFLLAIKFFIVTKTFLKINQK